MPSSIIQVQVQIKNVVNNLQNIIKVVTGSSHVSNGQRSRILEMFYVGSHPPGD